MHYDRFFCKIQPYNNYVFLTLTNSQKKRLFFYLGTIGMEEIYGITTLSFFFCNFVILYKYFRRQNCQLCRFFGAGENEEFKDDF